ncbi:MAG TPA: hypothetical protein VF255_00370 [Solirubrobacterales bacterium]
MKARSILGLCLLTLTIAAPSAPAAAAKPAAVNAADFPGYWAAFQLQGSNGYSIGISAYSVPLEEEEGISIAAFRKGSVALYTASVRMTPTTIYADLGALGKVDLRLDPSGRQKTIPIKCSGGDTFTFEPGFYEGVIEFNGEEGYTKVRETRVPLRPLLSSYCGGGSGSGESIGDSEPGARLRGVSYAQGRVLSFQVNKNRPAGAPTVFEASLRERRDGIRIYREVQGAVGSSAFRFPRDLKTATLSPPAPFSGSASLRRTRGSVKPRWTGNLALDFPGRSSVALAGPSVYVGLVHARFTCGGNGEVTVGLRPRCAL